jgi:hypothetical protein
LLVRVFTAVQKRGASGASKSKVMLETNSLHDRRTVRTPT